MKTAIVTDFLNQLGGAEKVTAEIASLYPKADIYALMAQKKVLDTYFSGRTVIQHPKFASSQLRRKYYRKLLPLYPTYIEDFNFNDYDLVISSSYLWAKGALCRADTVHISYIHTPMRQAWTKYHEYLNNENDIGRFSRFILRYVMNYMRLWDVTSSKRVDHFIANSSVVQKRIEKIYRREAKVIHPPVEVEKLKQYRTKEKSNYYITLGRLVPYKKIDLLIKAFNNLSDKKLLIIGDGNDKSRLEDLIESDNIQLLGYVEEERKSELVANAKAFLFAAEEDFGMSPVEAMALGTPVIAYNKGGTRDYIKDEVNGCFFSKQTTADIENAIARFEARQFDQQEIVDSVTKFDEQHFRDQFKTFVDQCL